jgi:hypothetical protein
MGTVLGFLWTLPNTILGLVLGLLTFSVPRLEGGAIIFDRRPTGVNALIKLMGRSAMTVGFVILGNTKVQGTLLAHEQHHIRQYMKLGIFFLPTYFALAARHGYSKHPFERSARRAAGQE